MTQPLSPYLQLMIAMLGRNHPMIPYIASLDGSKLPKVEPSPELKGAAYRKGG
jgi:hypothetical protein